MYKNFLCTSIIRRTLNVILGCRSNVIFNHLSNVILGFIPRIHTEHFSLLDTRVEPEYDGKGVDISTSEYDRERSLTKGLDVVCQCAALLERRVQNSTRVRKAQAVARQTNPIGRSMIEMLGVLAIIGVLSVGGIAGYSKAMEKFKINKTIQQITEIAANVQTLYMQQKDFNGLNNETAVQMGVVPDEVKVDKDKNEIILSNNSSLNIRVTTSGSAEWKTFTLQVNKLSKNDCIELAMANWNKNNHGLIAVNAKGYEDWDDCDIHTCYGTNGTETCCPDDEDGWVAVCAKNAPMTIQKALQGCTCTDADCEIIIGFS